MTASWNPSQFSWFRISLTGSPLLPRQGIGYFPELFNALINWFTPRKGLSGQYQPSRDWSVRSTSNQVARSNLDVV